jgi:hypothetical protein
MSSQFKPGEIIVRVYNNTLGDRKMKIGTFWQFTNYYNNSSSVCLKEHPQTWDSDKFVTLEVWNSPLYKAMREGNEE